MLDHLNGYILCRTSWWNRQVHGNFSSYVIDYKFIQLGMRAADTSTQELKKVITITIQIFR